ncbi:MAG: hypothetical protein IT287_07725 [Bdellovibrionaceae bacterium]|nr:hypothetical protein [Pseudobdellovibrionaceae bacterium]
MNPVWENDLCILKGESKAQDFIIRFSDIHSSCPALRDYNPAGTAYAKIKNLGRGVHLPACRPQPAQAKNQAHRCWMGFDVFGQSVGSCRLAKPQPACTTCQCDGRNGISWAD